jgi:hypothetical protein
MFAPARPQKITFAEMRSSGVRGLLRCKGRNARHGRARSPDLLLRLQVLHHVAISGDHWPDDVRLSDPRATSRQIKLAHGSVTRLDFVTRITAAIRLFA